MTRLDTLLSRRVTGAILFVAFLLLWAALTKAYTHSWQEESRLATVQALVEQGTFAIDHTEFNRTGDKVFVNGHFYSDKTPLLSVAAASVYSILHNVFGLTLDAAICVPDDDPSACRAFGPAGTRMTAFYWLTLIGTGVPSALLVMLFWKAMRHLGAGGRLATGLAVALGLASPIAPYSIVFAGHVPAALCLFAGFMLLGEHDSQFDRRDAFGAGVLISLSANIDLTLAVFSVTLGAWLLIARRPFVLPFALGAAVPLALSTIVNYWAAGTIVPLYFDPQAYDFFGTVLNKTVGGTDGCYTLEFCLSYTYEMLIGGRGVFSFTPMLVFALIGALAAARTRGLPGRGLATAMVIGCLIFTLYLIIRTDNFGGKAWGTRWFAPLAPVVWYYVAPLFNRPRRAVWKAALIGAIGLSLLTALMGLHDAWRTLPPLIRL